MTTTILRTGCAQDHQQAEEIAALVLEALVALPSEDERPGIQSLSVYGLLHAAAVLLANCPSEHRGPAFEDYQKYFLEATRHYGHLRATEVGHQRQERDR